MPAANVPMVIDQGEDWTTDVIWTDNYDEPVNVIHPCRMEIRGIANQVIVSLETNPAIPDGEIPGISVSSDIGLLQLHLTRDVTKNIPTGTYQYDLIVTTDDNDLYAGPQATRLLYGRVTVNKSFARV